MYIMFIHDRRVPRGRVLAEICHNCPMKVDCYNLFSKWTHSPHRQSYKLLQVHDFPLFCFQYKSSYSYVFLGGTWATVTSAAPQPTVDSTNSMASTTVTSATSLTLSVSMDQSTVHVKHDVNIKLQDSSVGKKGMVWECSCTDNSL